MIAGLSVYATLEFSRETCFLQLLGFLPVRSELRGWNNQAIIIYRSKDSKKFRWQAWSRSAITSSQICIWWRWWCRDFRLGAIHKVRQHFFRNFFDTPSPMSSLFLYLSVITFSSIFKSHLKSADVFYGRPLNFAAFLTSFGWLQISLSNSRFVPPHLYF